MSETIGQLIGSDGRTYPIGSEGISLGRNSTNQVVIADPRVSRLHARVLFAGGRFWVRDEGSDLGTFVNGIRVPGQQELRPGDVLQIGTMTFRFVAGSVPSMQPVQSSRPGTVPAQAKKSKLIYLGIAGVFLLIFVIGIGIASGGGKTGPIRTQQPPATGTITWNPASLSVQLLTGSAQASFVEFSSSSNLTNATVSVSPEIANMVSVEPLTLGALQANSNYRLQVNINAPLSTVPGSFSGTIQIVDNSRSLGNALTINLQVKGLSSSEIPLTVTNPSPDRIGSDAEGQPLVVDELVIGLDLEIPNPEARAKEIATQTGGVFLGSVSGSRVYQVLYQAASLADLEQKRQQVEAQTGVIFASHDYLTKAVVATNPNDNEYENWDEANPAGNNWHLEFIKAPSGWDITTGNNSVVIGVIDSDIDSDHTDLNDNIVATTGTRTISGGHGTHVSGLICAEGNNGQGVSGVMWDCSLRGYDYGTGSLVVTALRASELMVQAARDGARIVNMSLQWIDNNLCGTAGNTTTLQKVAENNAVLGRSILTAERENHDVLWIFAGGNECRDSQYASPASLTFNFPLNTIGVASVDSNGALSSFSNFGELITVAAPGGTILSTTPRSCTLGIFGCQDNYGNMSGTSMAAPQVTGLAGLVLSANPDFNSTQIKQCIVSGAQKAGASVTGHNIKVINVPEAIKCEGTIELPTKVDIVFALDLTGSMTEELERVKNEAQKIASDLRTIASPSTDFRFGLVSHEDYIGTFDSTPCGSTYNENYGVLDVKVGGDFPFRLELPLTNNIESVFNTLATMTLGGGDDGPESYGRVLWELAQADTGAQLGFRDDALKLVVAFGDSIPHDKDLNQGVGAPPIASLDTGIDPGRNETIDCGGDDIDFQDSALRSLIDRKIVLMYIDSSGEANIAPYWQYWTSQVGGAYAAINADGTIPGGVDLPNLIMDLLKLIPRTP